MKIIFYSILFLFSFSHLSQAQVVINEVQVANMNTIADFEDDYEDWIELYNSGSSSVSLAGYGISDRVDDLYKWTLPSLNLSAGEHVFIWASGKDLGGDLVHYETAIQPNTSWKYLVPTSEPNSTWRTVGFDDSGWNSGNGGFGYGDGDDGTDLVQVSSVYFRKEFTLENITTLAEVILHMDFDDSFVAYLNGTEITRANIGVIGVPPAFSDLSSGDHEANGYQGLTIDNFIIDEATWNGLLVEGENVLAVQVHNSNPGSSDLTGNAYLTFAFDTPEIQFELSPAWMGYNGNSQLHTNFKLDAGEELLLTDANSNIVNQILIPPSSLDHSYSRETSGSNNWCFAVIPTPLEENANTLCAAGYEPKPIFSIESGVFGNTQTISISSSSATSEIHYTTTGGIPTLSDPIYAAPIVLDTTATIAAKCFSTAALLPSTVEKNTYMIDEWGLDLPIISLSTDWANLYDYDTGIYVLGPPDYGGYPFFGSNFWEDWEREAYMEYFDADHVKQIEGPVGIKIHGGWSRAQPQKSFRLECRGDYGMDRMDYPLIPDKPFIESYKSINLRNGGNDYWSYRFHDAFMQRVFRSTHADYMGYSPAIVFLNGEYWGFMEIRENQDENWIEDNHGIDNNDVSFISSNYLGWNVISGSDASFYEMHSAIVNSDPLADDFYALIDGYIDLENLADYVIGETYYGNGDWGFGWNNTKFWHDDTPGGKWHFALMDLDFGMGCAPMDDYIYQATNDGTLTGQIFIQCIQNLQFRNYFINRYADLMNTIFQPEKMEDMIYEMRDELIDAFPRHCQLWGTDCGSIDWAIDVRLGWNETRIPGMRDVLQDHFILPNKVEVTLNVLPEGAGRIHISTVEPGEEEYPWTGIYYNGIPVRITAIANPGYEFEYWSANNIFPVDVNLDQVILNIETDDVFEAHFTGAPAAGAIEVTEFMYNDDGQDEIGDWLELHNKLDIPLNLSGMYIKDQNYYNKFELPLNTEIPAGGYVVIAKDTALFALQYPELENVIGPIEFSLNNDEDQIRLFNHHNENTVMISYTHDAPWPLNTDGTGRSVEFDENFDNQENPANWFTGCPGGSPGMAYDPWCTIGVDGEMSSTDWIIYPNPAETEVYILLNENTVVNSISLQDVTGKIIENFNVGNLTLLKLNVNDLPKGVYVIQLQTENGAEAKRLAVR